MSTLIPKFEQTGSLVNRPINLKLQDSYSITDFGAVGDDATDNTVFIQNAITAAVAEGKDLYIPSGIFRVSGTINITGPISINGTGWNSVIKITALTGDIFNVTTQDAVHFNYLRITASANRTAGSAVAFNPGSGNVNSFSQFINIYWEYQYQAIYANNNAYILISDNQFRFNSTNGTLIYLGCLTNSDAGDNILQNNQFFGGTGVTAIRQFSGGGTRVIGNKFLQVGTGYRLDFSIDNTGSGFFNIEHNNFDGCTVNNLWVGATGANVLLTDICINNNIVDGNFAFPGINLEGNATSTFGRITLNSNVITRNAGTADVIYLNYVTRVSIVGNQILSANGQMTLGANTTYCNVSVNDFDATSINNLGTGNAILLNEPLYQIASVNKRFLVGSNNSAIANGDFTLYSADNVGNNQVFRKGTQAYASLGYKDSTDTNFYVGNGGFLVGQYGVYLTSTASSWSAVSDETKKNIIEPISNAATKVASLRAVIGSYKDDEKNTRRPFLIAQDVQSVLPEAVSVADLETGVLGLSYTDIIPLLVAAITELKAEVDTLKAK